MSDEHPDVAELVKRNRETCDHPKEKREMRSVAVGAGWPMIGCHMEQRWFCSGCDKPVMDPAFDELVASFVKMNLPTEPEPACTCALDEDAPYGGHKVRCPRYGKRPL